MRKQSQHVRLKRALDHATINAQRCDFLRRSEAFDQRCRANFVEELFFEDAKVVNKDLDVRLLLYQCCSNCGGAEIDCESEHLNQQRI
jgi:hypothetical protein